MNDSTQAPVACSLSQADLARRAARWRELAQTALVQVSATPHGQRLAFAAHPGVADELAELAGLERGCCGFASWQVDQADDRLVLDISATDEEGVKAVQAFFEDLPRVGPA
jgi:hypothetical protein